MVTIKTGVIIIKSTIARTEPRRVRRIASWPKPRNKNLCPGKTPKTVSSSGAPRKMDGMKFRKVCEIAIAVMNMITLSSEKESKR